MIVNHQEILTRFESMTASITSFVTACVLLVATTLVHSETNNSEESDRILQKSVNYIQPKDPLTINEFIKRFPLEPSPEYSRMFRDAGLDYEADSVAEAPGGVFLEKDVDKVRQFAETLGLPYTFDYREIASEANCETNEKYILFKCPDAWIQEMVFWQMMKSNLFNRYFCGDEGRGGGSATFNMERGFFFKDPQRPNMDQARKVVTDFFNEFAKGYWKTANVTVTDGTGDFLFNISIKSVKNLVSQNADLWENVQIRLGIYPTFGGPRLTVAVDTDGKFASGARDQPPPPSKFEIYDPESEKLQNLADRIKTAFKVKAAKLKADISHQP